MEAHNRKPIYYRSTNPGLTQVDELASTLFQWDETLDMPVEIQNSKSAMPPLDLESDFIIWADTYTLGYTTELEAAPIFFTNGGAGDEKTLFVINHVANRLGESMFTDLATAKAWALGESRIYVEDDTPVPLTFTNTTIQIYMRDSGSLGNVNSQLFTDPQELKEAIYNWHYSQTNNGGSGSTYKFTDAALEVDTELYGFNENPATSVTGLRFHSDFGIDGFKIINWVSGVAQQVWVIGNIQGIINDGSDGFQII